MNLSFDTGSSNRLSKCPNCQSKYIDMRRFILKDGAAYAIAYIEAHTHDDGPAIYISVVFGTWDTETENDHITFTCRYGFIAGEPEYACSLVDVDKNAYIPLAGRKLSRIEALEHNKIDEFWEMVDYLLLQDAAIHDYLNHPLKSKVKTTLHLYG